MADQAPPPPPQPGWQPGPDPKAAAKAAKAYAKASRPWWKKKRFILLAVIVVIVVIAAASGGGSDKKDGPEKVAISPGSSGADNGGGAGERDAADGAEDAAGSGGGGGDEGEDDLLAHLPPLGSNIRSKSLPPSCVLLVQLILGAGGRRIELWALPYEKLTPWVCRALMQLHGVGINTATTTLVPAGDAVDRRAPAASRVRVRTRHA